MREAAKFVQGVFRFRGVGLERFVPLEPRVSYTVPSDRRAQLIYLRAGNSSAELVCLRLACGEETHRLFPIGAKSSVHVQLAISYELEAETAITLEISAPESAEGCVIVDIGLMEL
jgi:hypothetical protein